MRTVATAELIFDRWFNKMLQDFVTIVRMYATHRALQKRTFEPFVIQNATTIVFFVSLENCVFDTLCLHLFLSTFCFTKCRQKVLVCYLCFLLALWCFLLAKNKASKKHHKAFYKVKCTKQISRAKYNAWCKNVYGVFCLLCFTKCWQNVSGQRAAHD